MMARKYSHDDARLHTGGHRTGSSQIDDSGPVGANVASYRPRLVEDTRPSDPLRTLSLDELIATRDRFLTECFEIESGQRFVIDAQDADDRLGYLRGRIEEFHEELARRDMEGDDGPPTPTDDQSLVSDSAVQASIVEPEMRHEAETLKQLSSDNRHFLERTVERISLLDDLARLAREQGNLEQAAQCAVQAQSLDRERLAFLENFENDD
jgi:hypothetical protein